MGAIRRLRRIINDYRKVPIRPGHTYTDTVTGERFKVTTVGRWVEIERFDADRRPENKVVKGNMIEALRSGMVEHNMSKCAACNED